jgi:hypothetical protein
MIDGQQNIKLKKWTYYIMQQQEAAHLCGIRHFSEF